MLVSVTMLFGRRVKREKRRSPQDLLIILKLFFFFLLPICGIIQSTQSELLFAVVDPAMLSLFNELQNGNKKFKNSSFKQRRLSYTHT